MTKKVEKQKVQKFLFGKAMRKSGTNTYRVVVEAKKSHPLYGKVVMTHKSYICHYEGEISLPANVKIIESKHRSARKTWEISEILDSK